MSGEQRRQAELRARLAEVEASAARIVGAGDRELRRVERGLHDGAQQRLVGLALMLRLARRLAVEDPELSELLADATTELDDALTELRELARGIHPTIVDDAGLVGSLETLAEHPGVPVELHLDLPDRIPEAVAVAAYYLAAEAIANANAHAAPTVVTVRAAIVADAVHVTVADDGAGGATANPSSGLERVADRITALGGRFDLVSPDGAGTVVSAEIPLTRPSETAT